MHVYNTAGMLTAAGEGNLELPAKILAVRVIQHKFCHCLGIGRHIKSFILTDSG